MKIYIYTQRRNYLRMNMTSPILKNLQHAYLLMSLCIIEIRHSIVNEYRPAGSGSFKLFSPVDLGIHTNFRIFFIFHPKMHL